MVGSEECEIESITDLEIKCRLPVDTNGTAANETLTIYISETEQAVCSEAGNCTFEFADILSVTNLTNATPVFDEARSKYTLEISGANISDTDPSSVRVIIGEIE